MHPTEQASLVILITFALAVGLIFRSGRTRRPRRKQRLSRLFHIHRALILLACLLLTQCSNTTSTMSGEDIKTAVCMLGYFGLLAFIFYCISRGSSMLLLIVPCLLLTQCAAQGDAAETWDVIIPISITSLCALAVGLFSLSFSLGIWLGRRQGFDTGYNYRSDEVDAGQGLYELTEKGRNYGTGTPATMTPEASEQAK